MPKKFAELRDELAKTIVAARTIQEKAEAEDRDFTDVETKQLDELIARGKSLNSEAQRAKATETMMGALAAIGEGIEPGADQKAATMHPRVKASGGTDWADTMLQQLGGAQGYKGILANGTIAVNVPLNPDPVRIDVPVLSLRQLIPTVRNSSGRFAYLRQTVRTNNAAVVAAGALKPTSVYTLARVDDRVRTIAHLSEPIAKQDLDDIGMLRQFIDQEMRLGLDIALEEEILEGSGSGEHMTGMANVSGSQSQAFATDILTTARKAVTKLERYGYLASAGFVMTPEDWEAFELLQDNEGRFYYNGPAGPAVNASSRRLWGVPVVVSDAATAGTAHLADFSQMRLQVREDGVLDWSENIYRPDGISEGVGATDFERNLITFRFEGRFGLEILRPSAIVEIDLTA